MHTRCESLLSTVFPEAVPPLVVAALPDDWDPRRFAAGPIFSSTGRHRFYIADDGSRPAWEAAVRAAAPGASALLDGAQPGVRRMVDTDGERVDVYLDDLHLHGEGGPVVCETIDHPSGARSQLRFLDALPEHAARLKPLWGVGRLVERVGDRQSLLWITEAKYTGKAEQADALAAKLLPVPGAYWALRRRWPRAYIDGIELHPDGTVDLTPGFR